jgi:hypothetical protein
MVSHNHNGKRNFFMVNIADREKAVAEVSRRRGAEGVEALAPLDATTLDHYGVPVAEMRHFMITDAHGQVLHEMAY